MEHTRKIKKGLKTVGTVEGMLKFENIFNEVLDDLSEIKLCEVCNKRYKLKNFEKHELSKTHMKNKK